MPSLTKKICSVEGCGRRHFGHGYCEPHNRRLLKTGSVSECVPIRIEISHGMKNHPLYPKWQSMRSRCNNPNVWNYKNYGGRGIKVCKRWDNFANFLADMGDKPTSRHTLDRIDNDGNYEPGNCRWATPSQQAYNRRSNNKIW